MSDGSKIEWTDATWSPTTGCDRVSPGCDHCYALTLAARLKAMGQPKYQRDGKPPTSGPGFGLTVHPDVVNLPLRWRKPRRVFVNAMSDLFHAEVPDPWLADIFAVMATARHHTFQVLTKRHARMRSLLNDPAFVASVRDRAAGKGLGPGGWQWPLRNVWLGVSAEDQKWADIRVPALLDTPAAVRFVSAEPMLGPIDFNRWLGQFWKCGQCGFVQGQHAGSAHCFECRARNWPLPILSLDWVIVGGESGPGARPMDLNWAWRIIKDCRDEDVAVFMKQVGTVAARQELSMLADRKGGDWDHWPDWLRVRQFPRAAEAVPA